MSEGVWNLRTRRCFGALQRAMYAGAVRFGFRLVHYSVMGNHIHLIVELHHAIERARNPHAQPLHPLRQRHAVG